MFPFYSKRKPVGGDRAKDCECGVEASDENCSLPVRGFYHSNYVVDENELLSKPNSVTKQGANNMVLE